MAKTKTPRWVEQHRQILECIADEPGTLVDIAEATDMHHSTVTDAVKVLRDQGKVHVADWTWTPDARRASRMYLAGPGEDAPYPEYRRSASGWPAVTDSDLTPAHGWVPIRQADCGPVIQRDPFIVWLFGEAK